MKFGYSIKAFGLGAAALGLSVLGDASTNEAHATCVPEPYLGSVCITAGVYCPRDYVELNGGTLAISNYNALYAVIGTSFGGNGITTMGVPDLRGRSPIHYGIGPGLSPAFFGFARGVESITPDVAYLAEHSHAAVFTPSGGGGSVAVTVEAATNASADIKTPVTGAYISVTGEGFDTKKSFVSPGNASGLVELGGVTVSGGGSGGGTVTVGSTGESDTMSNLPPQLTMRFCMAIEGLFPPRT